MVIFSVFKIVSVLAVSSSYGMDMMYENSGVFSVIQTINCISKGMQASKLYSNKILQFLTEDAD